MTPPQQPHICYDTNGNLISITTACNNPEYSYDIKNRLVGVVITHSGPSDQSAERYYYTADNKRVSMARPNGNPGQAQVFYVYGAKSEIAAICTSYVFGDAPTCDPREPRDVKFAGRMVIQNYLPVAVDRLGSVVANPTRGSVGSTAPKYYAPFGEQYNEAQSGVGFPGNTNFATYFHEETTGLNYADQRFYNATYGRFMSADPYEPSAGPEDPDSWNRYSYVGNDPINLIDPTGESYISVSFGSITYVGRGIDSPFSLALLFQSSGAPTGPAPPTSAAVSKVLPHFNSSDKKTVQKARDGAKSLTANKNCDKALAGYGVSSLHDLVNKYEIDDNTFDGRTSIAPFTGNGLNTTVSAILATNKVAAVASESGRTVFLGGAFFNPSSFGVKQGFEFDAQEIILIHEAVHAFGQKSDAFFGSSKALSHLIIDKCLPAFRTSLGGLY